MRTRISATTPDTGPAEGPSSLLRRTLRLALPLLLVGCGSLLGAQGLSYGPFTLNAFAKGEWGRNSNQGADAQLYPLENKQRVWADQLVVGHPYGTETRHVTLFQPWLGVKFDIGGGFKLSALVSQRWRDGNNDIPGFMYEENVAISHENYGSLRIGKMTTRAWSIADYPYGTNVGLADQWGASGAGYGLNTRAIRYTAPTLDFYEGDLVLEGTYDRGNIAFKINKPRFIELYAQYHKGDLVVDAMVQDTRNGTPMAWGHGPFTGLTPFPKDDVKLGGSGQGIAMVMARYELNSRWQLSGGLRRNHWSGAYAVITDPNAPAQWNDMFNVNWDGTLNGVANPGYAATSVDGFAGLRYKWTKLSAWIAIERLGKASTANPSERGQSNYAIFNTAGLQYEVGRGLAVYASLGMVAYGRLGLSPMSMPGNSAFTGVDSRITKTGNWFLIGAVYVL